METIKIDIFDIDELDDKSKEKAINEWRNGSDNQDLLIDVLENQLIKLCKESKIKIIESEILYNFGYSQRDYLKIIGIFEFGDISIKIRGNELYRLMVFTDIETGDEVKEDNIFVALYDNISQKLIKIGYEDIEYRDSDEYIIYEIKTNEQRYFKNGDIFINEYIKVDDDKPEISVNYLPCKVCQYQSDEYWRVTYHPDLCEYVNHSCSAPTGYLKQNFAHCCIPSSKLVGKWYK